MSSACRPATPDDVPALVDALVSGFDGDPLYRWLYPDAVERAARTRETFEFVCGLGLASGELFTDQDRAAVAVWEAPGRPLLDEDAEERFVAMIERHVGARVEHVLAGIDATARHRPPEPHVVLHLLGVAAGAQGRGAGGALLAPRLARCDEQGVPAHLDSSSARNVPFYERLGFRVVAEEAIPDGGPVMRAMTRRPDARLATRRAPDG